jgi:RNA polymerase sigma-32 factor
MESTKKKKSVRLREGHKTAAKLTERKRRTPTSLVKNKLASKLTSKSKSNKPIVSPILNPEIVSSQGPASQRGRPAFQDVDGPVIPEINDLSTPAFDRSEVIEEYQLDLPEMKSKGGSLVPSGSVPLSSVDPVSRYMAEIARYPLLTRTQEEEVAKRYFETKDPRLAEVLVTANLRFVVKVAAEYSKFGARLIDLIQEGNVGLMHAVKEFDPYKGVKLITYAVWWIRGYIQEYLMRQYSMVRIGTTQNQRTLFYKLQKQKQDLEQLGEENGIRQISGRLGIPEDEVAEMHKRLSGRDVSLSQPLGQGESSRLLDIQTGDQGTEMDDMIELKEHLGLLNNALAHLRPLLSEKETYILDQRLLSDSALTLQDIGSEWGVTREAVRQMEARLLAKIKDAILKGGLPPLSEPTTTS